MKSNKNSDEKRHATFYVQKCLTFSLKNWISSVFRNWVAAKNPADQFCLDEFPSQIQQGDVSSPFNDHRKPIQDNSHKFTCSTTNQQIQHKNPRALGFSKANFVRLLPRKTPPLGDISQETLRDPSARLRHKRTWCLKISWLFYAMGKNQGFLGQQTRLSGIFYWKPSPTAKSWRTNYGPRHNKVRHESQPLCQEVLNLRHCWVP